MSFGQFQFRRGTAATWTSANPVLADGEMGIETDTAKFKIGNGSTAWTSLAYGGIQGPQGVPGTDLSGRNLIAGTGLTGGGTLAADRTFNIGANADGSIIANADDIQVGVLATDAQHGTRGGGTLHALATLSTPGFQSAADKTTVANHRLGWVNILDFGGDPTNVASSRTALTNAIAALPNGGVVFFPAGTYNLGNTAYQIDTAHITLKGATRYDSVITTSSLTEDIIRIGQYYDCFEDLMFSGPSTGSGSTLTSTRTAGYAINGAGTNFPSNTAIRRCSFFYQWDCINIGNSMMNVDDIDCRYFKHSGVVVTHASDHQINQMQCDNATGVLPTGAGIDIQNTASCLISNCNIIHANNALNISPTTGVTVPSVKVLNCFFDTSVNGLNCTGAGSVLRCEFTNSWFSSMSANGLNLQPASGGQVDGLTFINCDIYNNIAGTTQGVNTNAQVKKWKMVGCSIAGWTTGVNLVAGANHFPTMMANTIGSVSAFGVNTTGLAIGAGTYKGMVIANNDVFDNTTNFTMGALTVTTTTASSHRILDNPGINPRGTVTAPAASPVSATLYTNLTGFRVQVMFRTGATTAPTALSINGIASVLPGVSTLHPIILEPGGTISYTSTVAATWTWIGQ